AAPYMIKRNPLSYAQSATILGRQMGEDRIVARGEAFAFAPFVEALPNQEVSALPFTKDEVEGIAQYYREEVVSGRAATKDTLLIKAPDFKILHLSTHAFAAAADTVSAQILTGTDPVYLADLFGLHLSAELVTLSACQSNIGPLAQGEGVLGFGRAFTAAGAGGVVASLWSLNDRSTMEVLTSFYDKLAAGTTKPMALHEAQLAYLNRTDIPGYLKSPYYWAGLTYYGNAGTLPARRFPVWVWGVLIASLLLSLYVLSRILLRAKAKSAA
ncbi:MAG: CHAT domain-containing protein, partial [Bacteroidota bacterium]